MRRAYFCTRCGVVFAGRAIGDGRIVAEGPPATLGEQLQLRTKVAFTLPAGAPPLPPPLASTFATDGERWEATTERPAELLHALTSWALAEGVELEVLGIPALEAFQPLWSLALPGSALVIGLGYAAPPAVQELCDVLSLPFLDADELLGDLDEADPGQVAALISGALEAATGG